MSRASQKVPIFQLWGLALAYHVGEATHLSLFFMYLYGPLKTTWSFVKCWHWGAWHCCLLAAQHVKYLLVNSRLLQEFSHLSWNKINWFLVLKCAIYLIATMWLREKNAQFLTHHQKRKQEKNNNLSILEQICSTEIENGLL